jgi:hypothetical protein
MKHFQHVAVTLIIWQCCMPVFEGLFGQYDSIVMDLLWSLLVWHALAKFSWHSDRTLTVLDQATRALGWNLRRFKNQLCDLYVTTETDREYNARVECETKKGKGKQRAGSGRKQRTFQPQHVQASLSGRLCRVYSPFWSC